MYKNFTCSTAELRAWYDSDQYPNFPLDAGQYVIY